MEILVLWVGTCIASFCIKKINELKKYKDVADAGYKINFKRMSELAELSNPNEKIFDFILVFNILYELQRTALYNDAREMVLNQLIAIDALEKMSELEKTEYLKRPTGLNALIITLKSEIRLSKAPSLKINDGNEYSEIYFEMGKSLDDITILKVSGSASRLTVDEQKKKVITKLKSSIKKGIEKYGDIDTYAGEIYDTLKGNKVVDISDSKEEKKEEPISQISQGLSISEQRRVLNEKKQAIEELKNEILKKKEKETEQFSQTDTDMGSTLKNIIRNG